jgi:hypothetical protein
MFVTHGHGTASVHGTASASAWPGVSPNPNRGAPEPWVDAGVVSIHAATPGVLCSAAPGRRHVDRLRPMSV